jgi:hypothetical protein
MSASFCSACLRRKLDELAARRQAVPFVRSATLAVSATGCTPEAEHAWTPGPLANNELVWLTPHGGCHASWPIDLLSTGRWKLREQEANWPANPLALESQPLAMHAEAAGDCERLCGVASASLKACGCNDCRVAFKTGRGPFGENILLVTASGNVLASGDTWHRLDDEYPDIRRVRRQHPEIRTSGFRPLRALAGIPIVQVSCGGRLAGARSFGFGSSSEDCHKEACTSYALFLAASGAVLSASLSHNVGHGSGQALLGRRARSHAPQLVECLEHEHVCEVRASTHHTETDTHTHHAHAPRTRAYRPPPLSLLLPR